MTAKCQMKRQIYALTFAILEMNEYLDTHPADQKALKLIQAYEAKRAEKIREYEANFGPYVNTVSDVRGDRWTWVDNPWPWDFNKGDC